MTRNGTGITSCSWEFSLGGDYYIFMCVLYVIAIIILFTAIAIVCDDYFVPSLEVICKRLDLSEDVAGATFMAAGSSAPELFTSLAAVTNNSDIGVGTIVGSAVFNILIIISLTAVLCKNVLVLDWRPLTRDAFFYGVSIIIFSCFAWDGLFTWWESLITLLYYLLYIITLKFNRKLFRLLDLCKRYFQVCCSSPRPDPREQTAGVMINGVVDGDLVHALSDNNLGPKVHITPPTDNINSAVSVDMSMKGLGVPMTMKRAQSSGSSGIGSMTDDAALHTEPEDTWSPKTESLEKVDSLDSVCIEDAKSSNGSANKSVPAAAAPTEEATPPHTEPEEEAPEYDEVQVCCACAPRVMTNIPRMGAGRLSYLRYAVDVMYFMVAFPFQLLFSFTIPNSIKPHQTKYYLLSFTGSVVWIAILSYSMVVLVERFGCIVGINDYVMGLVVVAAGTSVPDALSSVIVAREGHGDMAVSNALGSNVFDINLGLGLPFLIKTVVANAPLELITKNDSNSYSFIKPHSKFGVILFGILLCVYFLICGNKFKLTRTIGVVFILIYVSFIAYAVLQELLCDEGRHC